MDKHQLRKPYETFSLTIAGLLLLSLVFTASYITSVRSSNSLAADNPELTISPNPIPLGTTTVVINGTGFGFNQNLQIITGFVPSGWATTDGTGAFSIVYNHDFDTPDSASMQAWSTDRHPKLLATAYYNVVDSSSDDSDNDGVGNEEDNCPEAPNPGQANQDGDTYGDACEQPNCVAIVNHWTVGPGDTDCDGYADTTVFPPRASEADIGTVYTAKCSSTVALSDEPLPDAWPPDFNDNQVVNGADILSFNNAFSKPTTGPPIVLNGTATPVTRFDLNGDGLVNGADVLQLNSFFSKGCAP